MCEQRCLSEDWSALPGRDVEIRHGVREVRSGRVEAAMADGSALWVAQNGPLERKLIAKIEGFTVRVAGCSCPDSSTEGSTQVAVAGPPAAG